MMRADYHFHTEYSDDSTTPIRDQIEQGIKLGLDELCPTDHVDYGIKPDWTEGFVPEVRDGNVLANVDYPKYFAELNELKAEYEGRIEVKKGLEFGIQSITVNEFQKLYDTYKHELDFVLFSMHQVDNLEFWTQDFQQGRTQKEYNERYYQEIYNTMKLYKDYSVLAHLDLLNRYDKAGIYPFEKVRDMVAEILKLAIADGKGIEINTSSWRYGLPDIQPSRDIFRLYKDLGGEIITTGSDAHTPDYLGSHFDEAVSILRDELGFKNFCTFEKMEPIFHKL